jgi:uncharacterized protein YukE
MKKIHALSVVICCAALLLVISGCKAHDDNKEKSYSEIMSEKLVSFTDCANAFSDSLEKIAGSKSAPSDSQIAEIRTALDELKKACAGLAGQDAPKQYSEAQQALDDAMEEYSKAMEKCDALLAFYSQYDEMYRKFKNPTEGRSEIEKSERAVYDEFAQAMQTATESFRAACKKFSKVK